MHNKIDFRDVQASGSYVSGYQALEFSLLEALEGNLSLLLGDVTMEHLGFLLEIGLEEDLIGFLLGLAEDDGAAMPASVEVDDIGYD